jgi:hypothetical protein
VRLRHVARQREEQCDRVLRRVAASTSTLSTPTPARPITFSCVPRSISSRVTFVAERTISAS